MKQHGKKLYKPEVVVDIEPKSEDIEEITSEVHLLDKELECVHGIPMSSDCEQCPVNGPDTLEDD